MNFEPDWETLLARHLDGQTTASDMAALNERLRTDAQARSEFAEMLNLDSALAAMAGGYQTRVRATSYRMSWPRITAMAAMFAVLATSAWLWWMPHAPFATVLSSAGSALTEGIVLRGEIQDLQAGTVELVTQRGARVVIEAPAAFRFESAQRLHLLHGRAAADVPPTAKGFTIVTPRGDAVDLGTKFGVDVTTQGAAEIHVFQGEVIAQPKGSGKHQSLRDGEALTLQPGTGAARELRPAAFIRSDEMASLSAGLTAGQKARSENALAALRHDPALIALLDFESAEPLPGTYRLVQGRWPGSRAPEFVNVGDHMKLDVGGDKSWPRLTLAAWVRLDQLGEPYQSLYHTDGWQEDKPGQVHWMINRDTSMRLALRQNTLAPGAKEHDGYPDSRTPVLPERGRWVHLAAVYDASAHTVRFYFNGAFDQEVRLAVAHPARLGSAQIGNWNQRDRKLSGRVDELLLLGRAMTDAEVRALHAAGNPYR
ncbi:MAG: LamG-like jellyroll fold domain-containing protein [Prosthecobacter sp.]|nr:LamG-like jellyroll fold domain-containing protein [Prosthecobacter sp.]